MALIGIALCGFLLLALVGTTAGRGVLKIAAGLAIAFVCIMALGIALSMYRLPATPAQAPAVPPAAAMPGCSTFSDDVTPGPQPPGVPQLGQRETALYTDRCDPDK